MKESLRLFRLAVSVINLMHNNYCFSVKHDNEIKKLKTEVSELMQQKDSVSGEVDELKVQLKIMQEARDMARQESAETNDKLSEGR